ncbi:MAG: galactokinase [Solirubrobacteraceae bacterium]
MPAERLRAFAPGRVNVIGEHTDYNDGLALPFAIADGVTVEATAAPAVDAAKALEAQALDLGERDCFPLHAPTPAEGWRGFVRGAAAELAAAGCPLSGGRLEIAGSVPRGAGLSSSAALEVALCLALIELGARAGRPRTDTALDKLALARLCSRVENEWTGANTGLLDQIASLFGAPETALCIDFRALSIEQVPLALGGWRFAVADSGDRHVHASSGYNDRRRECALACELLGIGSLRDARAEQLGALPEPLRRRAEHVLAENERVLAAVAALGAGDPARLGELLNASHASLRDLYEVSTPAVEAAVTRMLGAGAAGARLIGGGFGGSVLGLFAAGVPLPGDALEVRPGAGAHISTS